MKLKYLAVVLLLSIYQTLQSQEFGFGVRGGLNTYSIGNIVTVGSNGSNGPVAGLNFEPVKDIGFQFGGYFFAQFGKLYIRPELNYLSAQNHYDFPNREANWTTSKIDFPILVGYDIIGPISIYAGPGFNFFGDTKIDGVQETSFTSGTAGPDLKKSTLSLNIGITIRYKRLGIDLRYEMGQTEAVEEREDFIRSAFGVNLADLQAYKPNVLSLSVFYDIFRTDAQSIGGLFSGLFRSNNCYCPY
jgi:hypothetical protein